jgi:hypothetical protein
MTLIERVAELLAERQVRYALIGAAALAARGIARSTYDIDLLTTDARVLAPSIWEPLRANAASVDSRRGDDEDPLGGVVRVELPGQRPVDVVLGKQAWQARAVERAERPAGGLPVVTARDLVLLKLYAGGRQDLWDVRELLTLPGAPDLAAGVETDLADLPRAMQERWAEARA